MSPNGDVPKWLKGADSKSARRRKACGGSNPSISAIAIDPGIVYQYRDFLLLIFIFLLIVLKTVNEYLEKLCLPLLLPLCLRRFDKLCHPVCAFLFHLLCDVTIYIQRECRSGVA